MLNLYLVPKPEPVQFDLDIQQRLVDELTNMGIIGKSLSKNEYAPGLGVAHFFHGDAEQHILPGEMTFESLSFVMGTREEFYPFQLLPNSTMQSVRPVM